MFNFRKKRSYPIRKCRRILSGAVSWYQKHWKELSENELDQLENELSSLDQAVLKNNRQEASDIAHRVEPLAKKYAARNWWWYGLEFLFAIAFALLIATIVRQTWFEPYEIPTGSMRPTYREKDNLLVSKTPFGINIPLMTEHFYFDPNLVQRGSVVIWSGDKIDLPETDTTYFGILPYKKRYVKRLIGKPGDILYFYGGKIYGIDKEGNEILDLLENPWLEKLEYLPFSFNFEGKVVPSSSLPGGGVNILTFRQMNIPIGRTILSPYGNILGEIYVDQNWVKDRPKALLKPHHRIETYSDFWGIGNFAMARLLNKEQVQELGYDISELEEGVLYLELRHTPYLSNVSQMPTYDEVTVRSMLPKTLSTLIPLQQRHLSSILDSMYTARFIVERGFAKRYSQETTRQTSDSPRFPNIPNGTYEFYYGMASEIGFGGQPYSLPEDHPLYKRTPNNIQKLFNLGIEFSDRFVPNKQNQGYYPSRYAYFRNGSLYLMGGLIIPKNDPILQNYIERETKREQNSQDFYVAFVDRGPPLKEGKIDKKFVEAFGIAIPEGHYLVLGDNHAMSADSRYFGFVPEENLQGTPTLLLWPFSNRWGTPPQQPGPWFTIPHLIVWGVAALIFVGWYIYHRYRIRQPIFKKIR